MGMRVYAGRHVMSFELPIWAHRSLGGMPLPNRACRWLWNIRDFGKTSLADMALLACVTALLKPPRYQPWNCLWSYRPSSIHKMIDKSSKMATLIQSLTSFAADSGCVEPHAHAELGNPQLPTHTHFIFP